MSTVIARFPVPTSRALRPRARLREKTTRDNDAGHGLVDGCRFVSDAEVNRWAKRSDGKRVTRRRDRDVARVHGRKRWRNDGMIASYTFLARARPASLARPSEYDLRAKCVSA